MQLECWQRAHHARTHCYSFSGPSPTPCGCARYARGGPRSWARRAVGNPPRTTARVSSFGAELTPLRWALGLSSAQVARTPEAGKAQKLGKIRAEPHASRCLNHNSRPYARRTSVPCGSNGAIKLLPSPVLVRVPKGFG